MNHAVRILLVTFVLSSTLVAECNPKKIAKLKHRGFNAKQIEMMCYQKVQWIDPTEEECTKFRGKIRFNACRTDWQSAKKLCESMDAKLPPIELLDNVIFDCDGRFVQVGHSLIEDIVHATHLDVHYQRRYKEEGFNGQGYWSATSLNKRDALLVYYKNAVEYDNNKRYHAFVRCVKTKKDSK